MMAMLRPIAPFVEYAINQDYIAEFLCINKEKPEMQCNGKCHLYKELEKQQEETPVSLEISLKEYPIGFVNILTIQDKNQTIGFKKENYTFSKKYNFLFAKSIFHPPSV